MKSKILLIAVILCISGCGSPLLSKPAEVAAMTQNQGLIVGSLVLKAEDASPMFSVPLSGREWQFYVESDKLELDPTAGRILNIKPDGKEVPFVSIFTPGIYIITKLDTTSDFKRYELPLKLKFTVEEKKKTYIGRLVITIPTRVNAILTDLIGNCNVSIDIEDAQADTVALLSGEYGTNLAEGLQKELIKSSGHTSCISTESDPVLDNMNREMNQFKWEFKAPKRR